MTGLLMDWIRGGCWRERGKEKLRIDTGFCLEMVSFTKMGKADK